MRLHKTRLYCHYIYMYIHLLYSWSSVLTYPNMILLSHVAIKNSESVALWIGDLDLTRLCGLVVESPRV